MTYKETLDFLYNRLSAFHLVGGKAYKPGLDNTLRLMKALDNPHQKFPGIHIAGTNGKGSVSHYLSAILQEAGYKVGLYTSPHLVEFGERIRINGKMIEEQYVVDFVADNQSLIDEIQPSFFELTMAMAFNYFAEQEVDIAIVEVGLGGRLDSTNIIQPLLSVITNIGLDHVEFLGDTLAKIASEKAGIIKSDVPVIIGEALPETKSVFIDKAAEVQTDIYFTEDKIACPKFIAYEENNMLFSYQQTIYRSELLGLYQLKNLAMVFLAVQIINQSSIFSISEDALASGIAKVCSLTGLRGRWEFLQKNPAVVVDTAHNVAGMQSVVNQLQIQSYQNLRIIIGMVNDKDVHGVLQLLPKNAYYYFTQAQTKRAFKAQELRDKALIYGLVGEAYDNVEQAFQSALKDALTEDLVLVTGSNFVVGEALHFYGSNTYKENQSILNTKRISPKWIDNLSADEIFVFGSNLAGVHGAGAARKAMEWGAVWGQGVGLQGQTYAIPTMQGGIDTIKPYVDEFLAFAKSHPELKFLVTEIGCGIAGFTVEEIAPLFKAALSEEYGNVFLPERFYGVMEE